MKRPNLGIVFARLLIGILTLMPATQLMQSPTTLKWNQAFGGTDACNKLSWAANLETGLPKSTAEIYDLDILLPGGSHVCVSYDSNWTADDKLALNNALATYVPMMWTEFWTINNSAFVTMIRGAENYCWADGSINRDDQDNIVSYNGTVSLSVSPCAARTLYYLLHEWVHLFQFWTPNYFSVIGTHLEAVANAFAAVLIVQKLGWNSSEYYGPNESNQLVATTENGMADYSSSYVLGGYDLSRGWEELWSYDNQVFKRFNTFVASLSPNGLVGLRDAAKRALFESYADYMFDGLSAEDWLDSFAFFNGEADLPEGVNLMRCYGHNMLVFDFDGSSKTYVPFGGQVFVRQGGLVMQVSVSSFDVAIRDGQTWELLYSKMSQPATDGNAYFYLVGVVPFRDLLRVDVVAHLTDGGNLSSTSFFGAQMDGCRGDRMVFFLNEVGYAEGSGLSDVGMVSEGVLKWSEGNNVEANVTWNGHTYTYVVGNVMAHQSIPLTQIGIPLYQSRTFISPFTQTVNENSLVQLEVHTSPKVTSGSITLYKSKDLLDWTPIAAITPSNGYATHETRLPVGGIYYFKASWGGDGILNPSQSSAVRINVTSVNLLFDFDGNGELDMEDIDIAVQAYGSRPDLPNWNPIADVNGDDWVDMKDIAVPARHFGEHYS